MFPKEFDRHSLGSCMSAAAMATDYFLKKGITDFKIVEGWISLNPDDEKEDWSAHTWIEFKNGRKFDPTKKQWAEWGYDPNTVEYMDKIHKVYTPQQYQKVCQRQPSEWENFKKVVNERMSYKDLLNTSEDGRVARSNDVRVRPLRVTTLKGNEAWTFSYKSDPSTTGKSWKGYIKFFVEHVSKGSNAEDLDCIVDCSCPDFKFVWAYADTRQDASVIGSNGINGCINRPPRKTNPQQKPGLCKHLIALKNYLKTQLKSSKRSNLFEALDDVAAKKNFDVNYYD